MFEWKLVQGFLFAVVLAFCVVPQAAIGSDEANVGPPSGSVSMTFGRGALLLTAGGGHGSLKFNGNKYRFSIVQGGVGGIGGAKVTASGEVYNLTDLREFSGTYVELSAGYSLFTAGKGILWLKNDHGVVLKLNSKAKGFELTAGGQALIISLKKQRQQP